MKIVRIAIGIVLGAALLAGGWVVVFRSEWLKPEAKPEEPEPVADIPVHVAKVTRATLHKYVECFGSVAPAQLYVGTTPSTARVASPVPGVIAELFCSIGQRIEKGAPLFQLDERNAKAEESKAEAALASAQASLVKLKASTRPEQITVAEIALKKARNAVEFAQQNDARQRALLKDQLASAKQVEETASILAAAREDQLSAEKQLTLLKNTPPLEELAEAASKINEAEKALAAVRLQRSLLAIKSPLSGTVVKINAYPGEPVDTTNAVVELLDLNRLEINAQVSSHELKNLKPQQAVEIFCTVAKPAGGEKEPDDSGSETTLKSTLTSVGQQVDPKVDLATVHVALPANSGLQPGQAVRLRIIVDEHRNAFVVPEECVFRDRTDINVIAVVENGKSSLQNVKPGLRENGLLEIKGEDIKEGMLVVRTGAYGVPTEETKVHILEDDKKSPAREKK